MEILPSYETWKWIKGYEGAYEVSNRGRIRVWLKPGGNKFGKVFFRSCPHILKMSSNKWGYMTTHIGTKKFGGRKCVRVHREVAIAFIGNPHNKPEVNHINGDKKCNEWWNFEWVTRHESIDHAFRTGLIKPALGEAQSNTKLTNEKVLEIFSSILTTKKLSIMYGVSKCSIRDIRNGRTWWHLTGAKRHIKPSEKGRFKIQ